jgi:integrase
MESKDPRAGALRREPARMVALAKLWYETGMRSQDGLRFDTRKAVVDDICAMYEFVPFKTRKYGVVCNTFLSLGLWNELCALKPLSPGHPFWDGLESSIPSLETRAYQLIHEAGEQAFVFDCHPHRFRDSFAVNKLNAGARMEDVSRWLGHTNTRTTERYYALWVKSRQDVSRASFLRTLEAPQNVVVMPKARRQA